MLRCYTVDTMSLSRTPARLAPAATVAPPMQIITSLPNLCLGARERSVTHGQRASLANQGQDKTRCRHSINRQSTRECFQKTPGKPIPSRTSSVKKRGRLQFQVDEPFLLSPIRALRNSTHCGMIFRCPQTLPPSTPNERESPALEEGRGAHRKRRIERSKCSHR